MKEWLRAGRGRWKGKGHGLGTLGIHRDIKKGGCLKEYSENEAVKLEEIGGSSRTSLVAWVLSLPQLSHAVSGE